MKKVERYNPDIKVGLTNYEVNKRIEDKLVNIDTEVGTKTVSEIIRENVITLFNVINIILAVAVICVGSFKNLTFIIIITINTLISIIQELRSKKTLDKLKVVARSEEHTSELQSRFDLVCRLLLEKKKLCKYGITFQKIRAE